MNEKLKNVTGLYMEGIRDGHPREAVAKYTGDHYTQWSTGTLPSQFHLLRNGPAAGSSERRQLKAIALASLTHANRSE